MTGGSVSAIQDWRNLVAVEHCDRIKRLLRISAHLAPSERPVFYDGTVLASRLPRNVGVDIPILRVVFPERVFFNTDSTVLRPEAVEVANLIAESLRHEPPDVVMFVAGHADARASRAYNNSLSVNRANALAEGVLDRGVNLAWVWRVGFGEDLPLVAGNDEWAWGQNRRIEFLFAARPEALAVWLTEDQGAELCRGRNRAETDMCWRTLPPAPRYVLVRVRPRLAARTGVFPPARPPRRATPVQGPGRQVSPGAHGGTISQPQQAPRVRIDPTPSERITLQIRPDDWRGLYQHREDGAR
jgi:outer membrane protein OmpA-like peptidoglycan-associated protein